jgi:hypothetical protein
MPGDDPDQPFFLIVADHDRGVRGPDDQHPTPDTRRWQEAARMPRRATTMSSAAQAVAIAMNWRPSFVASTSSPAFRPAVL